MMEGFVWWGILYGSLLFVSTILAINALYNSSRSRANQLFAFLILFINGWIVTLYSLYFIHGKHLLLIGRLNFFFAEGIALGFLLLSYYFPRGSQIITTHKIKIGTTIAFVLLASLTIFTNLIDYAESLQASGDIITTFGKLYFLFIVFFLWCITISLGNLYHKYKTHSGIHRYQIKYLLLGILFSAIPAAITNIFLPYLGFYGAQQLGPIFVFALEYSAFYTIISYRLMGIKFVFAQITNYCFISLFSALYFYAAIYFIIFVWGDLYRLKAITFGVFNAFIFSWLFLASWKKINLANQHLWGQTVLFENIITEVSNSLGQIYQPVELTKYAQKILTSAFKIQFATVLAENKGIFTDGSIQVSQTIINAASDEKDPNQIFLYDELIGGFQKNTKQIVLQKLMAEYHIGVIIPLHNKSGCFAILLLGQKEGDAIYSSEEIKIIKILASHFALALNNALLYTNMEQTINEQTQNIKNLLQIKTDFLTVASHQLNTATSAVRGYLDMVVKNEVTGKQREDFIGQAYININRLQKIAEDILLAMDIEGEKILLSPTPTKLVDLIQTIFTSRAMDAKNKNLRYTLNIEKNYSPILLLDDKKIGNVLLGLIENAINYNVTDGQVTVSLKKDKQTAVISIVDTGIGIIAKEKTNIFKKFYRSERALIEHPDGSGLGLFIAKKVIEASGGKLHITSLGENKGCTVEIILKDPN